MPTKPPRYYADHEVKQQHDQRMRQQAREESHFSSLVDDKLAEMGYDEHEIPSAEDIEAAERAVKRGK